jgi:hypothetical protein
MRKKAKKIGRPKLPKGEAKGRIVPVRFTGDDLKAMDSSAKLRRESLSEWLRRVVPREVRYKEYIIQLATLSEPTGFATFGWIMRRGGGVPPTPVVPPGVYHTKEAALEAAIAWCKERIDAPWRQEDCQS